MSAPVTQVRTMNRGRQDEFERVFLFCPSGHEVGSAAVSTRTGRTWLAGDYSEEWCGYSSCKWAGEQ